MFTNRATRLAIALIVAGAPAVAQVEVQGLLLPVPDTGAGEPLGSATIQRERVVALRVDLLQEIAAAGAGEVALDLFDGARVPVSFERLEDAWGEGWVWHGAIDGSGEGSVLISVYGDAARGSIRTEDELYTLRAAGGGLHLLAQMDEERFPPCANGPHGPAEQVAQHGPGGHPHVTGAKTGGLQPAMAAPLNPPTIDVLAVYTTAAKNAEGGTNAMLALVNLAVAETNGAYVGSQMGQVLRLVSANEMVGYVETGNFSTELSRLRINGDGHMDEAHTFREQYGADAVGLIVNGTQYCGTGYLMGSPSLGFEDYAFSVTARTCATGYYSFGHELGHNFGSTHDRGNGSGGSYSYSFGYRTTNGLYRTIMAYAPGTRIQRFSNPGITWNGSVLGIAHPSPQSAENWKSQNNTAPITSQWRCAKPVPVGVGKTMSNGGVPVLTHAGTGSIASGSLTLELQGALPNKSAIAFYGFTQGANPWNGGTLYVLGPKLRLALATTNGSGDASWSFPLNKYVSGDEIYAQVWFRDPTHPDGTTVGLSNGLRIDACP